MEMWYKPTAGEFSQWKGGAYHLDVFVCITLILPVHNKIVVVYGYDISLWTFSVDVLLVMAPVLWTFSVVCYW